MKSLIQLDSKRRDRIKMGLQATALTKRVFYKVESNITAAWPKPRAHATSSEHNGIKHARLSAEGVKDPATKY
jgi:hypothetical protein